MTNKTIRIVIIGGNLDRVENLPPGWDYELLDYDNCEDCGGTDPNCHCGGPDWYKNLQPEEV